ncbi:hypothetical protein AXG93_4316s1340 [Marchantia polymorpha subsp. ruderalis]|uniref:Uncharacterized protein n=1 Tax=Marchantia polymorpha subsp. ruderalis TaxID=1480154 RepID=A0A176VTA4_MARPO|nr:hypothetical protein AXG93_4316s1340 [Marchantia polymorpha subsp. ruderalis]
MYSAGWLQHNEEISLTESRPAPSLQRSGYDTFIITIVDISNDSNLNVAAGSSDLESGSGREFITAWCCQIWRRRSRQVVPILQTLESSVAADRATAKLEAQIWEALRGKARVAEGGGRLSCPVRITSVGDTDKGFERSNTDG